MLAGSSTGRRVPTFFLYGEPRRDVGPRFLHLEPLEARCRPSDWTIRPHAHPDLHHLFLIQTGGGHMEADGHQVPFPARCLLTVPARTVHGFRFQRGARGQVLTVSHTFLREVVARAPDFAGLFARPAVLTPIDARGIARRLLELSRELSWSAPGHAAAVEASLLMTLVEILRQSRSTAAPDGARPSRAAALVARFRELVERTYRTDAGVEASAASLGVTPGTLRRACLAAAGCPPVQIIQERRFLEAQRLLLYTSMTVSEVAFGLGFDDAAYFNRFFSRRAQEAPARFRARAAAITR